MTERGGGPAPRRPVPLARWILLAALLGAAAGLTAVYGIDGLKRNAGGGDAACNGAASLAQRLKPLMRGEVAALTATTLPRRVPDVAFQDQTGKPLKLADFRGRIVLLNLWATWCVPCRAEMPALDRLSAKLGGDAFTVLAINVDPRDPEKSRRFLADVGVKQLGYYEDRDRSVFDELKRAGRLVGLPTSLLIDRDSCELAVLAGPAEWASEDAMRLIAAAIEGGR